MRLTPLWLLALIACTANGSMPADTASAASPQSQPAGARPAEPVEWSPDAFERQPRMAALQQRTPSDLGFEPGTTPWRPQAPAPDPAALVDARGRTADETVLALVSRLGWSRPLGEDLWELAIRLRKEEDGRATAIVLLWGLQDDAVAGHDMRITLVRQGDRWQAQRIEERFHCRRSVADGDLCA